MAQEQRTVVVQRDVPARKVPDGTRITIPKNSFVNLSQALGGTYTVTINGNMARIDGTDARDVWQGMLEQMPWKLMDDSLIVRVNVTVHVTVPILSSPKGAWPGSAIKLGAALDQSRADAYPQPSTCARSLNARPGWSTCSFRSSLGESIF